jgi:hypothetical protein
MSKRNKAGKLLSRFIRQIAEEETEFVKDDDGVDRMASKAEALARQIWRQALGYTEYVVSDPTLPPVEVIHKPDQKMLALLYDRMEGRAATATEDETLRPSTAQKISEQGKKRVAALGGFEDGYAAEADA